MDIYGESVLFSNDFFSMKVIIKVAYIYQKIFSYSEELYYFMLLVHEALIYFDKYIWALE